MTRCSNRGEWWYLHTPKKSKKSKTLYNRYMTEAQRDYLADLAGKKGVRLDGVGNVSAAWASKKIEELKAMPDSDFSELTQEDTEKLNDSISSIRSEVLSWTLAA